MYDYGQRTAVTAADRRGWPLSTVSEPSRTEVNTPTGVLWARAAKGACQQSICRSFIIARNIHSATAQGGRTDEDLSKHFHPRQPQKQSVTELGHLLTCESKQTNRVSRSLLSARLASILRRLSLSVCLVFIVVSIFGCQTSINVVFGRPKVTQWVCYHSSVAVESIVLQIQRTSQQWC